MARRAREHRKDIPGYDASRPDRQERKRQHRQVRHAANQMLGIEDDPDAIALPDVRRDRRHATNVASESGRRRFKLGKTKFWKRRSRYQDMKASLDSRW